MFSFNCTRNKWPSSYSPSWGLNFAKIFMQKIEAILMKSLQTEHVKKILWHIPATLRLDFDIILVPVDFCLHTTVMVMLH
jgi:hypothetical protein